MENVKIAVDGKKLIITIDLAHRGVTTDKGNTRVASTIRPCMECLPNHKPQT